MSKIKDIDKRINESNKLYNLADRAGKIKILENRLASYPEGHREVQYIKMAIERLKNER